MIDKLNSDVDQLKVSQRNNNDNTNNDHGGSNAGGSENHGRCCICGDTDHVKPECPQNPNSTTNTPSWRLEAPKAGEPQEKTVGGIVHKCFSRHRQNKGSWNSGNIMHFTTDHKTPQELGRAPPRSTQNLAAMAIIAETQIDVDFAPQAPIEVDFG